LLEKSLLIHGGYQIRREASSNGRFYARREEASRRNGETRAKRKRRDKRAQEREEIEKEPKGTRRRGEKRKNTIVFSETVQ
jgi:hypothetical protein